MFLQQVVNAVMLGAIFALSALGLAPLVVAEVMRIIREVREEGITVLLAEQNARMALQCADRGYVLETGIVKLEGNAKDLMTDQLVREAYLGTGS